MSEELQDFIAEEMVEVQNGLQSGPVFGEVTQYLIWLVIALIVLFALIFYAKKRVEVVPSKPHRVASIVEWQVDWIRRDVSKGVIGEGHEKHTPLLLSIFAFILVANLLGLLPGIGKAATGTIAMTASIALVSFAYFNFYGMKKQGVGRYWLNLAPKGVAVPLACFIWIIELLSLFLRFFTLAIRLFANMYAGHIVLGAFSVLTSAFLITAINSGAWATALPSVGWIILLIAMYCMEVMVACIQAYVFTLLTSVYISLAVHPDH